MKIISVKRVDVNDKELLGYEEVQKICKDLKGRLPKAPSFVSNLSFDVYFSPMPYGMKDKIQVETPHRYSPDELEKFGEWLVKLGKSLKSEEAKLKKLGLSFLFE